MKAPQLPLIVTRNYKKLPLRPEVNFFLPRTRIRHPNNVVLQIFTHLYNTMLRFIIAFERHDEE